MGRTWGSGVGETKRVSRRALVAVVLAGMITGSISVWARPASASSAPAAWRPISRDVRHADRWVLAGEQASRQIARTHAQVLFVGDSITQWWKRYGVAAWQADFAPLGAGDDGVAGDTTSNVLARIDDGSLDGMHPRLIVLMVGTNNIPLHQTAPEIARGVITVVAQLKARLPGARFLLLGVLPRDRPRSADRREVEAINRLLVAKASTVGVTYLDLGPQILGPDGRFVPGVMHADLLHPTAVGYQRMASRLAPEVRRLLSERASSSAARNP